MREILDGKKLYECFVGIFNFLNIKRDTVIKCKCRIRKMHYAYVIFIINITFFNFF